VTNSTEAYGEAESSRRFDMASAQMGLKASKRWVKGMIQTKPRSREHIEHQIH
jgi:hypothetical protein